MLKSSLRVCCDLFSLEIQLFSEVKTQVSQISKNLTQIQNEQNSVK